MTRSSEERHRGPAPGARVPDFFIVGHHKSGTTALYEMLRRHPQIFMPSLKEPRFFASDLRALVDTPPTSALPRNLEEYLALFAPAEPGQLAGEATPSYLRSHVAAGEIAQLAPSARCIAILREPASFVRSLHLQLLQEHVETERDLGTAFAAEAIVRNGRPVLRYSDHVHYVEQLRRFEAAFAPEQLLVLIYDDFRRDNEATIRRTLRFLDCDDTVELAVIDANPTVAVRSPRLDRMFRAAYGEQGAVAELAKRVLKTALPPVARRRAIGALRRGVLYGEPERPDAQVMLTLRRRYRPEVEMLAEHLDRDLVSEWGYDDVA